MNLNKLKIAAAVATAFSALSTSVLAADSKETSPIDANVSVVSNYVFRGISQSNFKPAIQGGFDYSHEATGLYIGNWNSSISWLSDGYGNSGYVPTRGRTGYSLSAPVEMDFYAGWKKELIGKGFASDIGVITYYYPTSGIPNTNGLYSNPNTTEAYIAQNFTFGPLTGNAKFSYALTNMFGTVNSNGSTYPEINLNYDTGFYGVGLNAHAGIQTFAGTAPNGTQYYNGAVVPNGTNNSNLYSYSDWKFGVSKDFGGGLGAGVAYTGTNVKNFNGYSAYSSPNGSNLGKSQWIFNLTKTF